MPFSEYSREDGVLVTIVSGVATDEDLIAYRKKAEQVRPELVPTRMLIDGREITEMRITGITVEQLAPSARELLEGERPRRCALVAASDVVYGFFRMWEQLREDSSFQIRVFRDRSEAERWLSEAG